MIRCEQLTKVYHPKTGEVRSLDGVDLRISPGEFVAIRGPSGCGKTTLLLALGGMLKPTAGRLLVDGADPYALTPRQRAHFRATKIGFVFQMFHLIPYLTVWENVQLAARSEAAGTDGQEGSNRGTDPLARLGLTGRMQHRPGELSAGERQRTALARALINRPKLILADEPTGNLDPENAAEVFNHLREFQRGGGTVIVVTHGQQVEAYAGRLLEMRAGKVVEGRAAKGREA